MADNSVTIALKLDASEFSSGISAIKKDLSSLSKQKVSVGGSVSTGVSSNSATPKGILSGFDKKMQNLISAVDKSFDIISTKKYNKMEMFDETSTKENTPTGTPMDNVESLLGSLGTSMQSLVGSGALMVAGFAVMTAGMLAMISLKEAFSVAFKPIEMILKGIGRIMGAALIPISMIIVELLRPFLMLMMPFIRLMNVFFRPFRKGISDFYKSQAGKDLLKSNPSLAITQAIGAGMISLFSSLAGTLGGTITTITGTVVDAVKGFLETLITGTITAIALMTQLFEFIISSTITAVDVIVKILEKIISGTISAIDTIIKILDKIISGAITGTSALIEILNKAISAAKITGTDVITKILDFVVSGTITGINLMTAILNKIISGIITGYDILTKIFASTVISVADILTKIFGAASSGLVAIADILTKVFGSASLTSSQVLNAILGSASSTLNTTFELLNNYATSAKNALSSVSNYLSGSFLGGLTLIRDYFYNQFFNAIYWVKDIMDKLLSAIQWVINQIPGLPRYSTVNDAIITPSGGIIRTDPSDYLIATKTPGALANAGTKGDGGNTIINNFSFTVEGNMDEKTARYIVDMVRRTLATEIRSSTR